MGGKTLISLRGYLNSPISNDSFDSSKKYRICPSRSFIAQLIGNSMAYMPASVFIVSFSGSFQRRIAVLFNIADLALCLALFCYVMIVFVLVCFVLVEFVSSPQ